MHIIVTHSFYYDKGGYLFRKHLKIISTCEAIKQYRDTVVIQADVMTCSLFLQHVMYLIDFKNKKCQKQKLTSQFHPMKIPCNSTLLGQVVIGSLSAPGEGLIVNSWTGETSEGQGTHQGKPSRKMGVNIELVCDKYGKTVQFINLYCVGSAPKMDVEPSQTTAVKAFKTSQCTKWEKNKVWSFWPICSGQLFCVFSPNGLRTFQLLQNGGV